MGIICMARPVFLTNVRASMVSMRLVRTVRRMVTRHVRAVTMDITLRVCNVFEMASWVVSSTVSRSTQIQATTERLVDALMAQVMFTRFQMVKDSIVSQMPTDSIGVVTGVTTVEFRRQNESTLKQQ